MKILFLCTAHNSLSQRLHLALSQSHDVTVEYAISDEVMIEAVALSKPDLVICPFLTSFVPKLIYENVCCLIVHPGPPGDAGPSSLEWLLLGDDGTIEQPAKFLKHIDEGAHFEGRSHWGVTVLQAVEQLDAGPVWAFQQFELGSIDQPRLNKSTLYRGLVTQAAVVATIKAVERFQHAYSSNPKEDADPGLHGARVAARPEYARLSVTDNLPFKGGQTRSRPLLRASLAAFDTTRHTAKHISRRIRCADSQPGVYSDVFGPNFYLYGGMIDDTMQEVVPIFPKNSSAGILAIRDGAVCIAAVDGMGLWITHVRKPKEKSDKALWPKVPAVHGLQQCHVIDSDFIGSLKWTPPSDFALLPGRTLQEVWVDFRVDEHANTTAYLHFEHYNGAMSTDSCSRLIAAMEYVLGRAAADRSICALVLMGGSYFSNGIALNVIEAALDPVYESWLNINRIDDVVHYILHEFPSRKITTFAAMRGNAAAGGVALAAACDFVLAGHEIVLNPAYRALGLHGSEYHLLTYHARCEEGAADIINSMLPMSPVQAQQTGLVDFVFPGTGDVLDNHIRAHVSRELHDGVPYQGFWKHGVDLSPPTLALIRVQELAEMSKDLWSPRSVRYHKRRFNFIRKIKPKATPLRFALHRQHSGRKDEEETAEFDNVEAYKIRCEEELLCRLSPPSPRDSLLSPPHDKEKTRAALFSCHYGTVKMVG